MNALVEKNFDELLNLARNNAVRFVPRKLIELNGSLGLIDIEEEADQ